MAEGVKLYQEFTSFLKKRSGIKIAWFTTFNFNVSFFERYLLSALAGTDYKNLRALKDYEALNQRLFGEEEDTVNVKVFHDFRAMRPEVKKTSVPIIGVDPKELGNKFKNGVFHPKVILIVDDLGDAWLVTGSANLSLSAWSSNCEVVVFHKIEDKRNAQAITEFYLQLLVEDEDRTLLQELNSKWQQKLPATSDWIFQHSLSGPSFSEVFPTENKNLYVWSPYYSDDVPTIVESTFKQAKAVNIIPDHSDKGTVKISKEVVDQLSKNERVQFYKDVRDFKSDFKPMVHAKVWLSEEHLAVGSWNFTYAGLNISDGRSNVEAGIVQAINKEQYHNFLKSSTLEICQSVQGVEQGELQAEREQLIQDWAISCQVIADWGTFQFTANYPDTINPENYYAELPGINERVSLEKLKKGVSFKDYYRKVLKDRIFSVYNELEGGKKVFMGIINEIKAFERPSIGFESINDLLRAWSDGKPENKQGHHELNYSSDDESGDEIAISIAEKLKGDYSQAWFSMFLAFEHIKDRLHEANGNDKELRIIGYKMPGSVIQLKDHLIQLKEFHSTEESPITDPYLWFLIEEGNQIISRYNKLSKNTLPIDEVEQIKIASKVDEHQLEKWLRFIRQECQYTNA